MAEVKQALNRANVDYAAEKARSVRRLRRTSVRIEYAGGSFEAREPFRILAGILTLESEWNPPFAEPLSNTLGGHDEKSQLDLGCVAAAGAFETTFAQGEGVTLEHHGPALSAFLLRLLRRLQQLGTAPAMDYGAYLQWCEEEE